MNIEAIEVLNMIAKKEVHELTETDKGFLRARRSYLTQEQKEKYSSVISNTPVVTNELKELQEYAKKIGIKAVHFYKTVEKLKAKIAEVEKK